MRKFYLFFSLLIICLISRSQGGIDENTPWRFVKGDSSVADITPIYGTKGFATEGNKPGARNGSAKWTDGNGNLWLFGGYGVSAIETGLLNDLWKYDRVLNQWIFIKGDNIINVPGIYGVQGIAADENKPGARTGSVTWIDGAGNLWLFGGIGYYTGGSGKLNDLWKFNPSTNQWTWVKGDNSRDVPGIYGTKGIAGILNNPGGRDKAFSWMDASGNLWLFGGDGPGDSSSFNDLWKYDPGSNQWIWVNGANTINNPGAYAYTVLSNNRPGARSKGATWSDNSGNLWLFGGYGYYSGGQGWFNDLWKYNIAIDQWSWVKGDSANVLVEYGNIGDPDINNKPGAREWCASWKDNTGNLWLFGGRGFFAENSFGYLNDLWRYEPGNNTWTWMKGSDSADTAAVFGTKFIARPANTPGSILAAFAWTDNANDLWLFGGDGHNGDISSTGLLNDLWKYNISGNQWTWMKGDSSFSSPGSYGEAGIVAEGNKPGARESSVTWKDNTGNLWMFGGFLKGNFGNNIYNDAHFNDLWKYDIAMNQWIWMKGDAMPDMAGIYGDSTIADDLNNPGSRDSAISWRDNAGNFWLFGGKGFDVNGNKGLLNDLWKYDTATNKWTWIKGSKVTDVPGVYGAGNSNQPGARNGSISWVDGSGKLWLFGGEGYDEFGSSGILNDLWKYDPSLNRWTWINGSQFINNIGIYQDPNPVNNVPGARSGSISWTDNTGDLWLFGGVGFDGYGSYGSLNDLWKYDSVSSEWVWVNGADVTGAAGIYGNPNQNVNKPGARSGSVSWLDNTGNLWMFGGTVNDSFLNDLWKYTISNNQWIWMKGDSIKNAIGSPGTKGLSSPTNKPMAKKNMASWTDNSGNLWMYGGTGISWWGNIDDLWKYGISNDQWTWVKGETSFSVPGVFGVQGIADNAAVPGARQNPYSWTDTTGKLWMFGGSIVHQVDAFRLNDLWVYNPTVNQWTWMKGDSLPNGKGSYMGSPDLNTPGARQGGVSWVDHSGKLWMFGGEFLDRNNNYLSTWLNDLWKYDPVTNQWAWIKGDSTGNTVGSYLNADLNAVKPGAREGSVSWVDAAGDLWLFGGWSGYDSANHNDLWKYTISTNRWIWVKGDSTANNQGVYGNMGQPLLTNKPGARLQSVGWTDADGHLWLFGGNQLNSYGSSIGLFNDVWQYNSSDNTWTWINGSNMPNELGTTNSPGARGGSFSWKDIYGNIFVFGGFGNNASGGGYLNEMWKYDIVSNAWTLINDNGLYAQSVTNKPGARYLGAAWSDPYGDLWTYGGFGMGTTGRGFLSDLWKISAASNYVFTGDGDWSDAANWVNNNIPSTTISAGMNVIIDHLLPGACTNHGPIVVQPFGRLKVESGKKLTIDQGDLANAGSIEGPGNRPGQLKFVGSQTSLLESVGQITTPIILDSKQMELSDNTTTDSITLTGGSKLKLNGFDLNIGAAKMKADSTNFVVTNGTGRLIRTIVDSAIFHIGINDSSYTPVTVINGGTADNFMVRVSEGIFKDSAITHKNVNRTWLVKDQQPGGGSVTLKMQWKQGDEQPEFNRDVSYISRRSVCPLPRNCSGSFFDASEAGPAISLGDDNYSRSRSNIDSFRTDTFIVTSRPFVYTFTGNGNWSDSINWTPGIPAPYTIMPGMEVIINPSGTVPELNTCISESDIQIIEPGKLTVLPTKQLKIAHQQGGRIIQQKKK